MSERIKGQKETSERIIDQKGTLRVIAKTLLCVDAEYQREASKTNINNIVRDWNWMSCGVITVVRRTDGRYIVVDGQHRVLSAMQLDDIVELPCIVFESSTPEEEAVEFVRINKKRKPVSGYDTYKAQIVANDPAATALHDALLTHELTLVKKSEEPQELACPGVLMSFVRSDKENGEGLEALLYIVKKLCLTQPASMPLIKGLIHIHKCGTENLTSKRLQNKLLKVGDQELMTALKYAIRDHGATKSACARAILGAVNVGCAGKIELLR